MENKNNEARRRHEDMALNRGLLWVAGAIVLEFLLLLVNRFYINYQLTEAAVNIAYALMHVLKITRLLGTLGASACLLWTAIQLYRTGRCHALPVVLLCATGAVAVCAHITLIFKGAGLRMLFILVPAWAALALVYYLYQKEFFLSGIASGIAAVGVWLLRASAGNRTWFIAAVVSVLLVAGIIFALKLSDGVLSAQEHELRILPPKANYPLMFLSCALSVLALILALTLGGSVAFYLIYGIVAWLFGLLVYYTVKLM